MQHAAAVTVCHIKEGHVCACVCVVREESGIKTLWGFFISSSEIIGRDSES